MLVEDVGPISRMRSDSSDRRCLSKSFHPLECRGTRLALAPRAPLELSPPPKRLRISRIPSLSLRLEDESLRIRRRRSLCLGCLGSLEFYTPLDRGALLDRQSACKDISTNGGSLSQFNAAR